MTRDNVAMAWRGGAAGAVVGGLLLLLVRGLLLWLLIPLGFLCWLLSWPWLADRDISLGQILGWLDLNLIAVLSRSLVFPLVHQAPRFHRFGEIDRVTHRIGLVDPL